MNCINKITFLALAAFYVGLIPAPATAHMEKPDLSNPTISIGGPFTLTNQYGKPVHNTDFRGKVMLVFFGFTHCPDICPVSVATLSKTMELLGARSPNVVPVFITVDPKRDTPGAMKEYLANFDKRIVGLTGADAQIKEAADAYKVYFSPTAHKKGEDYMVSHSGIIYMMGKHGEYVQHFPYDAKPEEIVQAVQGYLK